MSAFTQAVESALVRLSGGKAPAVLRTLARHAAQVVAVRSAGTVDLATDDLAVGGNGGLGGRPVLAGLPGVRLNLSGGDRVRVGFEGGSGAAGEVDSFEQDLDADRPAARKGDKVSIGTITLLQDNLVPPVLKLTIALGVSPFAVGLGSTILLALTATGFVNGLPLALGVPMQIPLDGWITTGSPEISLRHLSTEAIP